MEMAGIFRHALMISSFVFAMMLLVDSIDTISERRVSEMCDSFEPKGLECGLPPPDKKPSNSPPINQSLTVEGFLTILLNQTRQIELS